MKSLLFLFLIITSVLADSGETGTGSENPLKFTVPEESEYDGSWVNLQEDFRVFWSISGYGLESDIIELSIMSKSVGGWIGFGITSHGENSVSAQGPSMMNADLTLCVVDTTSPTQDLELLAGRNADIDPEGRDPWRYAKVESKVTDRYAIDLSSSGPATDTKYRGSETDYSDSLAMELESGWTVCKWRRTLRTADDLTDVPIQDRKMTFIWARGEIDPSTGEALAHTSYKASTSDSQKQGSGFFAANFFEDNRSARNKSLLLLFHGAGMTSAFTTFVASGIWYKRYSLLSDLKSTKMHRIFMSFACLGVLISLGLGSWAVHPSHIDMTHPHSLSGLILVIAVVFIQAPFGLMTAASGWDSAKHIWHKRSGWFLYTAAVASMISGLDKMEWPFWITVVTIACNIIPLGTFVVEEAFGRKKVKQLEDNDTGSEISADKRASTRSAASTSSATSTASSISSTSSNSTLSETVASGPPPPAKRNSTRAERAAARKPVFKTAPVDVSIPAPNTYRSGIEEWKAYKKAKLSEKSASVPPGPSVHEAFSNAKQEEREGKGPRRRTSMSVKKALEAEEAERKRRPSEII